MNDCVYFKIQDQCKINGELINKAHYYKLTKSFELYTRALNTGWRLFPETTKRCNRFLSLCKQYLYFGYSIENALERAYDKINKSCSSSKLSVISEEEMFLDFLIDG